MFSLTLQMRKLFIKKSSKLPKVTQYMSRVGYELQLCTLNLARVVGARVGIVDLEMEVPVSTPISFVSLFTKYFTSQG